MKGTEKYGNRIALKNVLRWLAMLPAFSVTIFGCADPITSQKVLTTVFDGVPALPPVEVLCEEHMADKYQEFYAALSKQKEKKTDVEEVKSVAVSSHLPYIEKNCQGCHNFKATNKLIAPKERLCFVCHKNFIQGVNVHGPVAVGDCLACHLPHDSKFSFLLQQDKSTLCKKCHLEKRLAENMHEQVISHNMECVDCHDPHSGTVHYFLK